MPTGVFCTAASGCAIEHFMAFDDSLSILQTKLFNYWLVAGKPCGYFRITSTEGVVKTIAASIAMPWTEIKSRKKRQKRRSRL